jgi:hypothetical protein
LGLFYFFVIPTVYSIFTENQSETEIGDFGGYLAIG